MLVKYNNPDWTTDNEHRPVHARWCLGWTAPVVVGTRPEVAVSSAISVTYLRWDFVVGPPWKGQFTPSGTPLPPLPPLGADLIVDLLISKDGGVTFISVFPNPADRPRLPAGKYTASEYFSGPVAAACGDQISVNVSQVGSTQAGQQILFSLAGSALVT